MECYKVFPSDLTTIIFSLSVKLQFMPTFTEMLFISCWMFTPELFCFTKTEAINTVFVAGFNFSDENACLRSNIKLLFTSILSVLVLELNFSSGMLSNNLKAFADFLRCQSKTTPPKVHSRYWLASRLMLWILPRTFVKNRQPVVVLGLFLLFYKCFRYSQKYSYKFLSTLLNVITVNVCNRLVALSKILHSVFCSNCKYFKRTFLRLISFILLKQIATKQHYPQS